MMPCGIRLNIYAEWRNRLGSRPHECGMEEWKEIRMDVVRKIRKAIGERRLQILGIRKQEEKKGIRYTAMTQPTCAAIFEVHQMMLDDDYMKARAADVKDISNRLVKILQGREEVDFSSMAPAIIVADDLSPSETVRMGWIKKRYRL